MKRLLLVLLLGVHSVFAGIMGNVEITGTVLKYDKKTVTIKYGLKKRITVSKKHIKDGIKNLQTGQPATIIFTSNEIMEKLRQQKEKQQASNQTQKKK
ncbi:MAG: hypothetical protein OXK80_05775 [Bdellovibrionales bacterium]|nr:hypothetical protein [Bdellovibrionales bacterium]